MSCFLDVMIIQMFCKIVVKNRKRTGWISDLIYRWLRISNAEKYRFFPVRTVKNTFKFVAIFLWEIFISIFLCVRNYSIQFYRLSDRILIYKHKHIQFEALKSVLVSAHP